MFKNLKTGLVTAFLTFQSIRGQFGDTGHTVHFMIEKGHERAHALIRIAFAES